MLAIIYGFGADQLNKAGHRTVKYFWESWCNTQKSGTCGVVL